jgi:hypothetical protein
VGGLAGREIDILGYGYDSLDLNLLNTITGG